MIIFFEFILLGFFELLHVYIYVFHQLWGILAIVSSHILSVISSLFSPYETLMCIFVFSSWYPTGCLVSFSFFCLFLRKKQMFMDIQTWGDRAETIHKHKNNHQLSWISEITRVRQASGVRVFQVASSTHELCPQTHHVSLVSTTKSSSKNLAFILLQKVIL